MARWLGAPLVVLLAIGVVSVFAWIVVAGLLGQDREILVQVTAGLEEAGSLPGVSGAGHRVHPAGPHEGLAAGRRRDRQPAGHVARASRPWGLTIVGLMNGAVVGLGAKGLSVALAMLASTLLANNTLQNLLEPVAFGRTLRLHPLVVLLVTTECSS